MSAPAQTRPMIDLTEPEFRSDPHAVYRRLRDHGPLIPVVGRNALVVLGHHELRQLMRHPSVKPSTGARAAPSPSHLQGPLGSARLQARRALMGVFAEQLPEDQLRLRRMLMPAFSRQSVADRRTRVRALADRCLDRAARRGGLDVISELSRPVALEVIFDILGIPDAVRPRIAAAAPELVYHIDTLTRTRVRIERSMLAVMAILPDLRRILTTGQQTPSSEESLIWRLERGRRTGDLDENAVLGNIVAMLMAGFLTTQHLVGNGMLALMLNREQWDRLCAQPELVDGAVEELLRFDPPTSLIVRRVLGDVECAGTEIQRGTTLIMSMTAANRDPAVFPDPDRLDIGRSPNPHIAFGSDAHYCLGAALARLEAQVMLGSLARRVPAVELADECPLFADTLTVRGLSALRVRF